MLSWTGHTGHPLSPWTAEETPANLMQPLSRIRLKSDLWKSNRCGRSGIKGHSWRMSDQLPHLLKIPLIIIYATASPSSPFIPCLQVFGKWAGYIRGTNRKSCQPFLMRAPCVAIALRRVQEDFSWSCDKFDFFIFYFFKIKISIRENDRRVIAGSIAFAANCQGNFTPLWKHIFEQKRLAILVAMPPGIFIHDMRATGYWTFLSNSLSRFPLAISRCWIDYAYHIRPLRC